jgi:hypothetical protein
MCYMSYVRWHWHWGSTRTAKSTDELALLCICCSLFCMRSGPISASLRGRTCANWSSPGTQAVHQAHMRCRATPRCAALRAGPEPLCNSSRPCCQCLHLGRRAAPPPRAPFPPAPLTTTTTTCSGLPDWIHSLTDSPQGECLCKVSWYEEASGKLAQAFSSLQRQVCSGAYLSRSI